MPFAEDRPLAEPDCWISLRTAEADHCTVSISGSLTAEAGRHVRRWVVLLRDAAYGGVALHCEDLHDMDHAGAALLQELVWGLEAQGRPVELIALAPPLQRTLADLGEGARASAG
ncbi:MAG TPA: STAS domain-containing protein [Acidimicrobiia bacterium]